MKTNKDIIIVKRFRKKETMDKWYSNKKNIEKLKKENSPKVYKGILNKTEKRVEIHIR